VVGVCARAASIDLPDLLRGVETRYNRARTLTAAFQQRTEAPRRGPVTESGELYLRKPGKMRWQYGNPAGKLFVCDGKFVYLYLPASNQVERSKVKESDDVRTPLAFLLGKLDFNRDFRQFTVSQRSDGLWITAEPRSDRAPYLQVSFLVTPAFEIRELEVAGLDNSTMHFWFSQEKVNRPVDEKLFQFQPPPGAEIVEAAQPQ
jgi:outer membrane lipoprotein carrier protein